MEKYLLQRGWLTETANKEIIEAAQKEIDRDREIADASPYPDGSTAGERVFCDSSTDIPFLYGGPKTKMVDKKKLAAASDVAHLR
jgi:hypothetical protein